MVLNDKKICLICSRSQEPYIIWLSFMVQICKMISGGVFFFNFKILIFQVVRGLKGQKMAQNVKKSVCLTPYLRNRISYDCDFWYICVKWWYLQQIFAFFKFWFFGFLGSKRAKNDLKLPISACLALYLRNCRSYHWDFDNDIHRCFSLFF